MRCRSGTSRKCRRRRSWASAGAGCEARVEQVHTWRTRRACWGELVQWDTSEHDWLEGRGEKLYLIAVIDDATSRAARVRHDSTEENLWLLGRYLRAQGRPGGVHRQG